MNPPQSKQKVEYEYVKYDKFIVLYVHDGKNTVPFVLGSYGTNKDGTCVEFNRYNVDVYFDRTVDSNIIWDCSISNKNDPNGIYSRFIVPSESVEGSAIINKKETTTDVVNENEKKDAVVVVPKSDGMFNKLITGFSSKV